MVKEFNVDMWKNNSLRLFEGNIKRKVEKEN